MAEPGTIPFFFLHNQELYQNAIRPVQSYSLLATEPHFSATHVGHEGFLDWVAVKEPKLIRVCSKYVGCPCYTVVTLNPKPKP